MIKEVGKVNSRIRSIKRFVAYVAKGSPGMFAKLTAVLLLFSTFTVLGNYLLSMLVGHIQKSHGYETDAMVLVFLVVAARGGSQYLQKAYQYYAASSSEEAAFGLQKRIIEKVRCFQLETFENPKTLDLLSRLADTFVQDGSNILQELSNALYYSIIIVAYLLILSTICWYYPLILLTTSVLSIWISANQGMDKYILTVTQSRWWRVGKYIEKLVFDNSSMKETRLFALSDYLITRWREIRKRADKQDFLLLRRHTIAEFLGKIVQFSGSFCCLLLYGNIVINGRGSLQNFYYILSISGMFFDDMGNALSSVKRMGKLYLFMEDIEEFETLDICEERNEAHVHLDKTISFEHVSFKYRGGDGYALNDINVKINPGETIVCVGENGAGKTTFIALLLGMLKATHGKVLYSSDDVQCITDSVRRYAAYVPQKFIKFQMKASESLGMGRQVAEKDVAEIPLLDFLRKMPNGMECDLGQLEEDGIGLSGGEWQRLAVARALLKQDTDLLVMDEFSAALDPLAEAELYASLDRYMDSRTVVITSHRLGVCKLADRILVFSKGAIIEEGSHDSLIKQKGEYYRMYQAQSALYREGDVNL